MIGKPVWSASLINTKLDSIRWNCILEFTTKAIKSGQGPICALSLPSSSLNCALFFASMVFCCWRLTS